jgi:predicted Zn-dependent protease
MTTIEAQSSSQTVSAAQQRTISADKKSPDDNTPLTTFEEEIRAKRAIKLAEKEHEDNLKRAREICQIGQDLKAGLSSAAVTTKPDPKKVDRLEKLTKKIRGEAGGEDDDVQILNAPADIPAAVNQIAEAADQLSKDVQKTPRQVVSAAVIDRANVLLELVKILRGFIR